MVYYALIRTTKHIISAYTYVQLRVSCSVMYTINRLNTSIRGQPASGDAYVNMNLLYVRVV